MDHRHDRMRMNVEDDRLSNLSDDLIHKILSFTSIKHAIQASVLSSRWRFIWTSMPYLNFSRDDFVRLSKISAFVTRVLSDCNNQADVSSVKLRFDGNGSHAFIKQIMTYAFSHNIQQLDVTYLLMNEVEFPLFRFSSRTLKHLSLSLLEEKVFTLCNRPVSFYLINVTSPWELPFLITLYLHRVTFCCDDESTDTSVCFFSKCANLKNLTLKSCNTKGFEGLSICLHVLSDLTLMYVYGSVKVINIVAPQLKNLTIRTLLNQDIQYPISAPDLVSLFYKGYFCLRLSTGDFRSLEKADVCINRPKNAHQILQILCLLQQLHNVKSLKLNLEIVELLSSSVELMSNRPSPFGNLKSLKIYPATKILKVRECDRVKPYADFKPYLLGDSFSMVTRQDMINMNMAENLITELRALLEQDKVRTETKMAKMHELVNSRFVERIANYTVRYVDLRWKYTSSQIYHFCNERSAQRERKGVSHHFKVERD